jgi:hypothetical protein
MDQSIIKESEIEIQIGFNKMIQDWNKFIDCLSKDDDFIFMELISDCYGCYYKSIHSSIKEKSESHHSRTMSLFMALILYQQKQIDTIKRDQGF